MEISARNQLPGKVVSTRLGTIMAEVVVEVDPAAGKILCAQWVDNDQAQNPPGNGDLFGIAMIPDGSGFYYVEDDVNTLVQAQ